MAQRRRRRPEFSKRLTIVSWAVTLILTLLAVVLPLYCVSIEGIQAVLPYSWGEVTAVQAFYLWKAKNENRTKVPMKVIESLPAEIRAELDMTQVITSIIQSD